MRISALVPTYNRREFAPRAIRSILAQSVVVDEIIIVDDGSTDGTADSIEHEFGSRVRVVRQANQGVAGARLKGVQEATGDWIAFLDSDDEWTPDRNRIFRNAIESVPTNVGWIFGNLLKVTDDGVGTTQFEQHGLTVSEAVHVFSDSFSVLHPIQFGMLQSSVIKRQGLTDLNCFAENYRKGEDIVVGYQIATRYKFAAVPDTVSRLYRTSDLRESSLTVNEHDGADDYFRAMMQSFSLAANAAPKGEWGECYAETVRKFCRERAFRGEDIGRLPLEQFRFRTSMKSLSFALAAFMGTPGLRAWQNAGGMLKALVSSSRSDARQ